MNILDQLLTADPSPTIPSVLRNWSADQLRIFEFCRQSTANLQIDGVAGCGKTTTICEATSWLSGSNLFVAFNKAIVEELASRGPTADVKTLNSLGAGVLRRNRPLSELDKFKTRRILQPLMTEQDYSEFGGRIAGAIGLAKSNAFGIARGVLQQDFSDLINSYQLDIPAERLEDFSFIALQGFEKSLADRETHDFDDQVYIPLLEGWRFYFWSNVLVDEDQDLNPLQHLLLERMNSAGSRIIGVGDRWQSIYGFRGAMTNSIDLLKAKFHCEELPLSISYRCARRIVEEAQLYCPQIQARPGAPEGEVILRVEQKDDEGQYLYDDPVFWPPDHMILCRNNAPLFKAILRYVRAKRPCCVRTNFLEGFRAFFESFKATMTLELDSKLDIWYAKERSAAEKSGFRGKLASLEDKYSTAKLLCKEYLRVDEIIALLNRLGDSRSGTIFSTIHKAKGLEAEHVYLLRPDLCPSPFAVTPESKQQELNLLYVAITRAKLSLTFGMPLF